MRARRVFCLLLAAFLLAALLPQALAAGLIETDRPVTLTVRFFHDKAPVSGAPFSLYRVADVSAYGEFTLTGDFKDDPVRLDDRSSDGWRALAETLRAFVLRDSRKPLDTGVTGSTGLLTFPNRQKTLRPGLYLLLGESFVSGGYSYTVEPSLICLPCAGETSNTWDYDAALAPKHDREPLPPAPSDDTVERKVLKVWDDGNAASQPQEITVQLLKDGVVYDTVRLNAKNSWRYTWSKLPKYDGVPCARLVLRMRISFCGSSSVIVMRPSFRRSSPGLTDNFVPGLKVSSDSPQVTCIVLSDWSTTFV